jgi:hypothetical protein
MSGPKGLRADISSLERFGINKLWLAKKFLLLSGPVRICIKFHLNPELGVGFINRLTEGSMGSSKDLSSYLSIK